VHLTCAKAEVFRGPTDWWECGGGHVGRDCLPSARARADSDHGKYACQGRESGDAVSGETATPGVSSDRNERSCTPRHPERDADEAQRAFRPYGGEALVRPMSRPNRRAIARTVHCGILKRNDLVNAALSNVRL
jgi:hypothetical protein